ncbi:MAG: S24 family peptidase [Alphaproteobacteria bacterium]|nr:S24 family peptidase [Alphaproteobacteria bacterium]
MPLLSKLQYTDVTDALSPAICKSGDLRLPTQFKALSREYLEGEFAVKRGDEVDDAQIMTMNDEGMFPTIAGGAKLVVDLHLTPKHNDIVVAEYYGQVICRRIFISQRKCWLYGDDKDFKFIDLSKCDELVILGVVTSHFMTHSLTAHTG